MQLPPPVQEAGSQRNGRRKKTRISLGLRAHFDHFLRKLGSGTAPSTSSAIDESTGDSMSYGKSRGTAKADTGDPDGVVDEVVVDREWSGEIKSSVHSGEHGGGEKSGESRNGVGGYGGTSTDRESLALQVDGFWASNTLLVYLRYRIWPAVYGFFATHVVDEKSEAHYRKESWFLRKSLALWASAFYIVNWALAAGVIPHPADTSDTVFYYAVAPALTFPVFFMVVYDFPRDRPILYQIFLTFSTWMWSIYQLFYMFFCGFYGSSSHFSCENKDFLLTFYYTCAFQTIALFGLGFNRFPALIGVVIFFGLACGIVVPEKTAFLRNLFNFLLFQAFLLYVHFMRENAERRLYTLRDQLKIQFRATQKAQVNERKAADSKRRLTSYVFHEVRVPLNTALLAVQNMDASGAVAKSQEIEFKALEGSLNMMSKVLNDVLDFNRMDSGRFESVLKPYAFHQAMRSLFVPLRMATDARGLEFITDLDLTIDEVARAALREYQGENGDIIARLLQETQDEDGIVVGDETRLRQIVTNLASNACKFTPTGGKLMITTKLVLPTPNRIFANWPEVYKESKHFSGPGDELPSVEILDPSSLQSPESSESEKKLGLSTTLLNQHDVLLSKPPPLEWIVVRIEVTDTGCGIRQKDMAQTKLFSAFNQTEMGRQQGGKGTGLGLALVRQIVKRSGGRLGVRSKVHEGSTFWVELPLGVGSKVAAGSNSPQAQAYSPDGDPSKHRKAFRPRPPLNPKNFSPLPEPTPPEKSGSALHSIMEQGGLVEISTKSEDHTRVPTRTINDFSARVTEAARTYSSTSAASSASPTTPADPSILLEEKPGSTVKPTYLDLPNPATLTIPDTEHSVPPSANVAELPSSENMNDCALSTAGSSSVAAPSVSYELGMRVLVVDDDPLTRKLMTRMLTRLGCKVTTAENGEIALDLILALGTTRPTPSSEDTGSNTGVLDGAISSEDEPRYAVVFLDNQMPVMSGLEAVGKLRRRRGHRDFVVGVTGNALLSDQEEYVEAGVDHVLTKPVLEKSIKAMLAIADERRKRGIPLHDES
ncbi:hypothetical protein BDY19DRAFT_983786 [Irpex rosettiformis]|uniref:Uncharacterized protein n=1 Tax=Irpex rosettiformis TaxID=378272 RepID=A0ACB8UB43_9APHY|nr:hypothetical protein BDY19DRAFT_983786 [Irpex rosettiformis]